MHSPLPVLSSVSSSHTKIAPAQQRGSWERGTVAPGAGEKTPGGFPWALPGRGRISSWKRSRCSAQVMGAVLGGAAARTGATAMAMWAGLATLQPEPPSSVSASTTVCLLWTCDLLDGSQCLWDREQMREGQGVASPWDPAEAQARGAGGGLFGLLWETPQC